MGSVTDIVVTMSFLHFLCLSLVGVIVAGQNMEYANYGAENSYMNLRQERAADPKALMKKLHEQYLILKKGLSTIQDAVEDVRNIMLTITKGKGLDRPNQRTYVSSVYGQDPFARVSDW